MPSFLLNPFSSSVRKLKSQCSLKVVFKSISYFKAISVYFYHENFHSSHFRILDLPHLSPGPIKSLWQPHCPGRLANLVNNFCQKRLRISQLFGPPEGNGPIRYPLSVLYVSRGQASNCPLVGWLVGSQWTLFLKNGSKDFLDFWHEGSAQ